MASPGDDCGRYARGAWAFGAIGEEVKRARMEDDLYNLNFEGGVLLESPSTSSDGSTGSLRELVRTSEPLVRESPRAARLLSANQTELCIPNGPVFGSPNEFDSIWSVAAAFLAANPLQTYGDGDCSIASRTTYTDVNSSPISRQTRSEVSEVYSPPTPRQKNYTFVAATPQHRRISVLAREDHLEIDSSPTPRPARKFAAPTPQHRRMSLADLKRTPPGVKAKEDDFEIFLPTSQLASISSSAHKSLLRSDTIPANGSSASERFNQKAYKELFMSVNSKLESTLRKLVLIRPGDDYHEKHAFAGLTAYHLNYDRINIKLAQEEMIQPALVHGLIWRMVHDLLFTTPVLDCAPSPHAQAYKEAWLNDVGCCTPAQRSSDWTNVKGPLMRARVAAVREVMQTTPNFDGWVKEFSVDMTTKIVERLDLVWRQGTKAQAIYELTEPITKLVRIAVRMRSELRHFDFHFLEYGAKARSDKFVQHNANYRLPPPPADDDVDYHVVLTLNPEVAEKNYEEISKVTIFKAEVVVSKNFKNNAHLLEKHRGRKVVGIQNRNAQRTPRRRLHYN